MKVLLFCDHKWRDLPPLSAIRIHLERMGHRALIVSTRDGPSMIPAYRPDCVVLNHFWGAWYNRLARGLRERGIAVLVLSTEGAGRPIFHQMDRGDATDFSLVDRLYSWGWRNTEAMVARGSISADRAVTSGCPRIDFYRQPLMGAVKPRAQLAAEYGLDPARPIIAWATQFPHAHVREDDPVMWANYCASMADFGADRCFAAIGVDFRVLPKYHADLRDTSADLFFRFARENPDLQFVLKPHPNEPRRYYEDRLRDAGCGNVRFCGHDYIWNVLHSTDVLLHRHCTTAVEAWLCGKPTIEFATVPDAFMAWPEREAGSVVARDFDTLSILVREFLDGRTVDAEQAAIREAYIHDWFGVPDGRRCLAIAEDIDALLRSRRPARQAPSFAAAGVRPRNSARVVVRHALSLPSTASLRTEAWPALTRRGFHARPELAAQKNVTRRDVRSYVERLRPLTEGRAAPSSASAPPTQPASSSRIAASARERS